MHIFKMLFCVCLMAAPYLNAEPSHGRDWENWKDDDVTELIHEYWIRSQRELDHREALARLVKSVYLPGERFLEAGCGSGLVYKQLVPSVMVNSHYCGIDITQNMLDIARRDFPKGIFLKDDLYNLSFENNSFEIVVAFEVLGHLPSIEVPIREMCRVASRLVLFTVWSSSSTVVTEERFRNSQFIHTAYSDADIRKAIKSALGVDYTVKAIPLNEYTVAYMISL